MNFDEYMKKIQIISNILEQKKYAEDVLNSKELNIEQDFQYICLSNASNYNLVNDVIARLAQNGNRNIVEENIKYISINMWKELFNKNDAIKNIFINNFNEILKNAGIITFREIEPFIENNDTRALIYENFDTIVKKLCTYDRASLIVSLKNKEQGIENIKIHLESFFQKGEYDISTTYSKILINLSNIPEISSLDILIACNKHLEEMLSRETAIDNETNKLLNWLYDNFEETQMSDEQRNNIKQNIDKAILENFDYILDKCNYDKNTIKILKQFNCAREKFDKNKNHYIQKSEKQNYDTKIYKYNVKKKDVNLKIENNTVDEILEEDKIYEQNQVVQLIKKYEEKNIKDEDVIGINQCSYDLVQLSNAEIIENISEHNNEELDIKEELFDNRKNIQNKETNIDFNKKDEKKSDNDKIMKINPLAEILEANDIIAEINARVESFNAQMNSTKKIVENKSKEEESKLKLTTSEAQEIIKTLVNSHLYETEKIIDKVMKRNKVLEENCDKELVIKDENTFEEKIEQKLINDINLNELKDINKELNLNIKNEDNAILESELKQEIVNTEIAKENKSTEMIVQDSKEAITVPENIFKRILRKILKLFKFKFKFDDIEN